MDIEKVKELALANGFKLKEQASGNMDLNAYIYDFANAIEQAAKAQAVPEWINYELEKPKDGQKCLVIFESRDCEDAQRWMCIDEFNEGVFDFIANWEDQCATVALPEGSVVSKVHVVCWAATNLSNAPLSFDQFYEAQEPAND